ncbi:MAG: penicillin acylase family protein [Pseudomonadota bacterium]
MKSVARGFASITLISLFALGCGADQQSADKETPVTGAADSENATPSSNQLEIVWDEWGVPHIDAPTAEAAFYGMGWSQARGRGELVVRLLAQGRGHAAKHYGKDFLQSDMLVHTMGVPDLAKAALEAQGSAYAKRMEAYVKGINDFAEANPEAFSETALSVLPVSATDVLGHNMRSIHLTFVGGRNIQQTVAIGTKETKAEEQTEPPGSNAWAVAPSRSESNEAMLLANPHLRWSDLYYFFEAHVRAPGVNTYGVSLIGNPVLTIAFNENLGWTHTVNTYDGADVYAFDLVEGGYNDTTGATPFEETATEIEVLGEDGELVKQPLTIRRTSVGPVIHSDGEKAYSIKIAGLEPDRLRASEQYWEMGRATNLTEFETAMSRIQNPMFNTVYADKNGDIFYLFNALAPVRAKGDASTWNGILDGADPEYRWDGYLSYEDLPKLTNPPSGFVQNANEPPWTATTPTLLDPADYPADLIQPFMRSRPQHSLALLTGDDSITFDEFVEYSHSSRMVEADNVLDDLIKIAIESADPLAVEAAAVFENWDREARPDSQGGVLFYLWALEYKPLGRAYDQPWSFSEPNEPPRGVVDEAALEALKTAAAKMKEAFGRLDAPWRSIARVTRDGEDISVEAAPGDLGAFRVAYPVAGEDGSFEIVGGTTYVAAISFGDRPYAKAILPYGNFETRPSWAKSQWPLFEEARYREVRYEAADVDAGEAFRETLTPDL